MFRSLAGSIRLIAWTRSGTSSGRSADVLCSHELVAPAALIGAKVLSQTLMRDSSEGSVDGRGATAVREFAAVLAGQPLNMGAIMSNSWLVSGLLLQLWFMSLLFASYWGRGCRELLGHKKETALVRSPVMAVWAKGEILGSLWR